MTRSEELSMKQTAVRARIEHVPALSGVTARTLGPSGVSWASA